MAQQGSGFNEGPIDGVGRGLEDMSGGLADFLTNLFQNAFGGDASPQQNGMVWDAVQGWVPGAKSQQQQIAHPPMPNQAKTHVAPIPVTTMPSTQLPEYNGPQSFAGKSFEMPSVAPGTDIFSSAPFGSTPQSFSK